MSGKPYDPRPGRARRCRSTERMSYSDYLHLERVLDAQRAAVERA